MIHPFNSNRNYNLIFKEQSGKRAEAQIQAFEDTWHWDAQARDTLEDIPGAAVNEGRMPDDVARMVGSLVRGIGHSDMSAYLVMMAPRLVQLHRVCRSTGSLYLHCDQTANGYLRVVLDAIFGPENFRSEITWRRTNVHSDAKTWSPVVGTVLYHAKDARSVKWNPRRIPHSSDYVEAKYRSVDSDGRRYMLDNMTSPNPRPNMMYEWKGHASPPYGWRYERSAMEKLDAEGRIWYPSDKSKRPRLKRYLDEMSGVVLGNVWTDIDPINSQAKERLGYPTRRPMALLERILLLRPRSSSAGGSASTSHTSQSPSCEPALWTRSVSNRSPFTVCPLTSSRPGCWRRRARTGDTSSGGGRSASSTRSRSAVRRRADKGTDGVLTFSEHDSIQRILVSVKSGKPSALHVKELIATLNDQEGAIGLLIELDPLTEEMKLLAVNAGQYESQLWGGSYERIQILTIDDVLRGKKPEVPKFLPAHQKAAKIAAAVGEQQALWEAGR